MMNDILVVLKSKEIIILTIVLVVILTAFNLNLFIQKRSKKKIQKTETRQNPLETVEPPGRIIVPDSTYDLLMKEKEKKYKNGERNEKLV